MLSGSSDLGRDILPPALALRLDAPDDPDAECAEFHRMVRINPFVRRPRVDHDARLTAHRVQLPGARVLGVYGGVFDDESDAVMTRLSAYATSDGEEGKSTRPAAEG